MINEQNRYSRRPLQIQIVEDNNFFEPKTTERLPESDNLEQSKQSYKIHRLKNDYKLKKKTEQSLDQNEQYDISISDNDFSNRKPIEADNQNLHCKIEMVQQQLQRQRQEKMELILLLNEVSKKSEQCTKMLQQEKQKGNQIQRLNGKVNMLKKINRKLQAQIDAEREYSKKLQGEINDVMNYKNTGIKVQNYRQKNKEFNQKNKQNSHLNRANEKIGRDKSNKNLKLRIQ